MGTYTYTHTPLHTHERTLIHTYAHSHTHAVSSILYTFIRINAHACRPNTYACVHDYTLTIQVRNIENYSGVSKVGMCIYVHMWSIE